MDIDTLFATDVADFPSSDRCACGRSFVADVSNVAVIPYNPHTCTRAYSLNRKISDIGDIGDIRFVAGGQR